MSLALRTQFFRRIVIVDADADQRDVLAGYLREHGFETHCAASAREMDALLAQRAADLVILEAKLPDEDGLAVCRRLTDGGGPAVMMLTGASDEVDRVLGLELGADDYLAKSCSLRELLARIRAVLRRVEEPRAGAPRRSPVYRFAGFEADVARRQLRAPTGAIVLLTAGEFTLLRVFLEQPQRVLSREQLLELARGGETNVFDRAVDVQVSRLRRKLHACAETEVIRTLRGVGYMLDVTVSRV